jgi:DNA-directed RNA polymerase subunit beta
MERLVKKLKYLAAEQEDETVIAQANAELDESSSFVNETVFSRMREGNYTQARIDEIEYMDVATNQITSLAGCTHSIY